MLISRDIKVLHLEPTDVCQAMCPLCPRELDKSFDKTQRHHLSVSLLESILPAGFVSNLDKMFMCGNYGDPAANHQTLDIYNWFRQQNPNIIVGMNTNGALQTKIWWYKLSQIMNQPRDYVVFSIDGLEDTNNEYRIGVNWKNLMQNVATFISGGGSAHWDMLVYRHNEHQVDHCEQLARDMGFKWFRAKVSKRPLIGKLQTPILWQKPNIQSHKINCHALQEQSIYIDSQGRVSPCCWLGSRQSDFVTDFNEIQNSWNSLHPNIICVNTCGSTDKVSNFIQQWQKEVQL